MVLNRPRMCGQHKKALVQEYKVLGGVAQRQGRHSCFVLDSFVVVKVDVSVNHLVRLGKRSRFVPVDALCLEDGKEIFRHRIVIGVSAS